MHHFTPVPALVGGALIGLAVTLVFLTHGRTAGISGLWGGLLSPGRTDRPFRLSFFLGLIVAGAAVRLFYPAAFGGPVGSVGVTAAAGLLVGYGTRLGGGCTSGHGVCGISRFEVRSLVATGVFIAAGAAAVFATRGLR